MTPNGVTNGPCNTSNPSNLTACLEDTAALTLSCVLPGQDAGVAPPRRRLPASLPSQQGSWPFYPIFAQSHLLFCSCRNATGQGITCSDSRSHCAAAPTAAGRYQLNTPHAAAAA